MTSEAGYPWSSFTVDPHVHPTVRAGDIDRDAAAQILAAAFAEGRLDHDEYDQRLTAVMAAKTVGEFLPLLDDVAVLSHPPHRSPRRNLGLRPSTVRGRAIAAWVATAVVFNVLWTASWFGQGTPTAVEYWPLWAMLLTAIPAAWIGTQGGQIESGRSLPTPKPLPGLTSNHPGQAIL